jgi:hypothetical protein
LVFVSVCFAKMETAHLFTQTERHGSCNNHPQVEAIKVRFGAAGVGKFELPPHRQATFYAQKTIEMGLHEALTMDYANARADLVFLSCFAGAENYGYCCACFYQIVDNREVLRVQVTRWAVPAATAALV